MASISDPFDEHLERWQTWAEEPWGRIRFAVVGHLLGRHVDELVARTGAPLRVLDVGGGDARDSVPLAAAGHDVTVLDTSPRMLAEAVRRAAAAGVELRTVEASLDDLDQVGGGFDLVLCHFVLHYRRAADADVPRLARALAPGGRLSIVAPNPVGRVVQRLTREGPAAALAELGSDTWATTTFQHTGRQLPRDEVAAELAAAGLGIVGDHGARIANDLLTDDDPKDDPAYFADLLRLELALCDEEPWKRFGALWQLVAERASSPTP